MSRRPAATARTGMTRAPSLASISMPPPNKIPSRQADSVPPSPRKSSVTRRNPALSSSKTKDAEAGEINIQVVVRCRGRSPQELASTSPIIAKTDGAMSKAITVETTPMAASSLSTFTTASSYGGANAPSTKTYPFDRVFGPEADQAMIFDEVAEGMLDEVLAGYNCSIFAYGQTGTGKTYTMQGDLELSPLAAPNDNAGIVPRVLHRLFALLTAAENTEFSVKCSYVELYNEELRDLLSAEYSSSSTTSTQNGGGLKLYEDGKKGTMIQGLEEVGVKNLKEALAVVNKGCMKRQVAETKMNTESSRSHTILSITVHIKEQGVAGHGEDLLKVGKFNLIDLAGSEAIGRSGATDKRAREAGMINQSLLTLGRVISALVEKGPHIPYRESKLTRLLQDSLGGKTKTCIVATVSPTRSNMEETLSTLDYAIRAKSIRNRPELNQHLTKTGLLKEYLGDIERLKAEVLAAREKNGVYIPEEQWSQMQDDLAKQKSEFEEAKLRASAAGVELATKKRGFDDLCAKMLATSDELKEAREAERQLGLLVEQVKAEMEENKRLLDEERVVAEAYERGEERIDGVARELRDVAKDSVSDVGGLFDKLARKAQVLGANANASTRFGADLQGLSRDVTGGLQKMSSAHGKLGQLLEAELSAHAEKGRQIADNDVAALEASLASFTQGAQNLSASIASGSQQAAQISQSLCLIKNDLQNSVQQWASNINDRNTSLVEEVLTHQQEHLDMVGSVLDSTVDLVDAVITTARDHVEQERQAAEVSRRNALEMANAETSRLRAQNAMLAQMLVNERAKTNRLRSELIGNLTSLIADFTDAQNASWSEAVGGVLAENESGVEQMAAFASGVDQRWTAGTARSQVFASELDMAQTTSSKQRTTGCDALGEVRSGVRDRLEVFGRESADELARSGRGLDVRIGDLGSGLASIATSAEQSSAAQQAHLASLGQDVATTHASLIQRAQGMSEDIAALTSTVLSTHAKSSKSFAKSHESASSAVSILMDRTARFLESDIQEDVPTGTTPQKRAYKMPAGWERTEPREALIAAMRSKPSMSSSLASLASAHSIGASSVSISPSDIPLPVDLDDDRDIVSTRSSLASYIDENAIMPPPPPLGMGGMGLKQPTARLDASLMKGKREREEMGRKALPLHEGGANIPRRVVRK